MVHSTSQVTIQASAKPDRTATDRNTTVRASAMFCNATPCPNARASKHRRKEDRRETGKGKGGRQSKGKTDRGTEKQSKKHRETERETKKNRQETETQNKKRERKRKVGGEEGFIQCSGKRGMWSTAA